MKEIAKLWQALSHSEKQAWQKKSEADKIRYQEELKKLPPSQQFPQAGPVRKVRRKKGNKDKPKRVMTPYLCYVKERRPQMNNMGLNFGECMRRLADEWKQMPDYKKMKYITLSEEDRDRHNKEAADYKEACEIKKRTPVVNVTEDGVPKRPQSAYMTFAKEIKDRLKYRMPGASSGDIMRAVSIEWARLPRE